MRRISERVEQRREVACLNPNIVDHVGNDDCCCCHDADIRSLEQENCGRRIKRRQYCPKCGAGFRKTSVIPPQAMLEDRSQVVASRADQAHRVDDPQHEAPPLNYSAFGPSHPQCLLRAGWRSTTAIARVRSSCRTEIYQLHNLLAALRREGAATAAPPTSAHGR
jgi:hypothetical protein